MLFHVESYTNFLNEVPLGNNKKNSQGENKKWLKNALNVTVKV